jgi:RNA polymerase sigma-B factor
MLDHRERPQDPAWPAGDAGEPPLAGRDDDDLLAIVSGASRGSEQREAACQVLVQRYGWLVSSCVQQYSGSPEFREDLMQVGYVGLLTAINRFDPELGTSLPGYARPCISGEIKRHFRDKRWQVRVRRPIQELRLRMREASGELTQQLSRSPREAELAEFLQVSIEEVREARLADEAFLVRSLDTPLGDSDGDGDGASLGDFLGSDDPGLEQVVDMEALRVVWPSLPEPEQRILMMRYYGGMTQADIGLRLRISQMQVSRLQARALRFLRNAMLGQDIPGTA